MELKKLHLKNIEYQSNLNKWKLCKMYETVLRNHISFGINLPHKPNIHTLVIHVDKKKNLAQLAFLILDSVLKFQIAVCIRREFVCLSASLSPNTSAYFLTSLYLLWTILSFYFRKMLFLFFF